MRCAVSPARSPPCPCSWLLHCSGPSCCSVDAPVAGMWASMVVSTLMVAGIGALAPRRHAWEAPTVVSAITAGILTLDALLGTPLHRGSPLGPAPTLGGRFYGFGNPTYSVYVVAMVVTAAAVATWLLRRGHRRLAVAAAAAVTTMATT